MTVNNEAYIKRDRLRFTKNKLSSNLTLLAILINAFYFVSIYSHDVGSYYYNIMMGVSVIYNLLFMLIAFLSAEGVKAYKISYSYVLIGLGIGQIIRIFIIPMQAHSAVITLSGAEQAVMDDGQFIWDCCLLVASAAICIIAGIIAFAKTRMLASHQTEIDKKQKGASHE